MMFLCERERETRDEKNDVNTTKSSVSECSVNVAC